MTEESYSKRRSSIQCLSINANNHVTFYEECKLLQDKCTRQLIIKPSENEKEYIYVAFDRCFIRHNDILYIDSCETDSNKYAVIFRDVEQCERFIESLNKRKDQFKAYITVTNDDDMFKAKFLIPVAKQFEEDPFLDPLQSILEELIDFYDKGKCQEGSDINVSPNTGTTEAAASKEIASSVDSILNGTSRTETSSLYDTVPDELLSESINLQLLNLSQSDTEMVTTSSDRNSSNYSVNKHQRPRVSCKGVSIDYSDDSDLDYCNDEQEPTVTVLRANNNDSSDSDNDVEVPSVIDSEMDSPIDTVSNTNQNKSNDSNIDVDHSKPSIDGNVRKRSLRQRLNISYQINDYALDNGSNGNADYCMKESESCKPKKSRKEIKHRILNFSPRNEEIYPPNFKFINYIRMGNSRSRLFIFPKASPNKCYEYFYDYRSDYFVCCGCNNGKRTHAIIKQDSEGNNYVECLRTDHVCKLRKFEPEKYKTDLIIKKPNYKEVTESVSVQGRKEKKKSLLLFTSVDQKRYYKLRWDKCQNLYACLRCMNRCKKLRLKSYVQACVRFDTDGNEFVYVRNQEHICSKMKYIYLESDQPTEFELTTDKVPERQWIKRYKSERNPASNVLKRSRRRKTNVQPRKSMPRPIRSVLQRSSEIPEMPNLPIAQVSNEAVNNLESQNPPVLDYYCKKRHPRKSRITLDKTRIIKPPNYQFLKREWNGKMLDRLMVFASDDKKQCYEYNWSESSKRYVCTSCTGSHKLFVSAKVMQNQNGEEFIQLGPNNHKCNAKEFLP